MIYIITKRIIIIYTSKLHRKNIKTCKNQPSRQFLQVQYFILICT